MSKRIIRSILTLLAIALASAMIVLAQAPASSGDTVVTVLSNTAGSVWQQAQAAGTKGKKLVVVTRDQPDRRHSCRVQSFTEDKLVCSRAIGGPRTYLREQIAALILPGNDVETRWVLLGLNGGLGASIWGTVVLTAACPACAAATAFAAFVFFGFAGAVAYTDDVPDKLLYLAPGQELSRKFEYVQR